jgi:hypothetical protein
VETYTFQEVSRTVLPRQDQYIRQAAVGSVGLDLLCPFRQACALAWPNFGTRRLIPTCIHPPQEGEPLALSIAVSADPSAEASTHLQAIGTTMGHLRLAPAEGASSQAIISPEHAWSTALKLRDEVRRIVATLRPPAVHLFLATPGGLALLLGHVWDRMPLTQTYEDLGPNGYQPAFIIPN